MTTNEKSLHIWTFAVEDDALSAFHQTTPSRYEEKNIPERGIK